MSTAKRVRSVADIERDIESARWQATESERAADELEEELEAARAAEAEKNGERAGCWAALDSDGVCLVVRRYPGGETFKVHVADHPAGGTAGEHIRLINETLALRWTDLARRAS